MRRRCVGFHQDDDGDWVAELECLHGQHQRHQPPFQDRAWVLSEEGRASRIGADFDCPLCDRAEPPDGLVLARTAGPWDQATLPAGLRREHRVGARTWGVLRVLSGSLSIDLLGRRRHLDAGDEQPIPPDVPHLLTLEGDVRLEVDFLVAPTA